MSTENYLQIYDDNVVKFSIKQGVENDRWPITGDYKIEYSNSNTTALKYENNNNLVVKESDTLPGAFTIAELACTRNTNRVFIGNFSDELSGQQQTVGGALVGNKYLGFIDSKPALGNDADSNAVPGALSSSNNSGLLEEASPFRSYNHVISGNTCQPTEDKMWSKQSYYNSKYDAYDGDYMYDIYRNALIIFDHNIKPSTANSDGSTVNSATLPTEKTSANNRRVTPLIPYSKGDDSVKSFTKDMYGDGYVLLYNVIPDGDTLTFSKKKFEKGTGTNANNPGNYSQNIIKLNKVPIGKIMENLDGEFFTISNNKITLQNLENVGSGSGGTDVTGTIDSLTKGSLKNIYNKTITANRIIISDGSGYIKSDSGIPSSLFSGIKTEKTLETRLSALESKSAGGGEYATSAEFNSLKKQVEDYHKSGSSTESTLMVPLRMWAELTEDGDNYITPNKSTYLINYDDFKDDTKNGVISVVNSGQKFKLDRKATLLISLSTPEDVGPVVHVFADAGGGEMVVGGLTTSEAGWAGGCLSLPILPGITYRIGGTKYDDVYPHAYNTIVTRWFYAYLYID